MYDFNIYTLINTDKLVDTVNEYINAYHNTIKMKPVHVKSSTYLENNNKGTKFDACDVVRISRYRNLFSKSYTYSGLKETL